MIYFILNYSWRLCPHKNSKIYLFFEQTIVKWNALVRKKGRLSLWTSEISIFDCQGSLLSLFQLWLQTLDIIYCFIKFILIWAAATKFKEYISCWMNYFYSYLQQFYTNGIHRMLLHFFREYQPFKPIEYVVCQGMYL